MATFDHYKRRITEAMKASGIYNRNLSIQIENLALSLWTLSLCREEMQKEDFEVVTMKTTRDGEQPVENPIFKVLARTQSDISRQMKLLKLTVEDIVGKPEVKDGVDEMYEAINNIRI